MKNTEPSQAELQALERELRAAQKYEKVPRFDPPHEVVVQATREAGKKQMMWGAIWFLGGLIVTCGSFALASQSSGGGRYWIAWGAVIWGAIQFIQGVTKASAK